MIRTVVCQREGCCGNKFHIETIDNNLEITCKECGSKYLFDVSYYDFVMLSNCSSCNNDTFKLFRDVEKEGIYAKCSECGEILVAQETVAKLNHTPSEWIVDTPATYAAAGS